MKEIMENVINKMLYIEKTEVEEKCPISIIDINKWEWAQGVGLYGLYRYYEVSGEKSYLEFMKRWYQSRIAEGLPEKSVNTCSPLLALTYIHENKKEYLDIMYEWATWLTKEHPRTEEGGIAHTGSGFIQDKELWDDTLFMCILFLARAGVIFDRPDWLDETKKQFLIHIKYLTDRKTGLLFHGWSFDGRHHFGKALWGRGNCWITVGIPDYIDIMGDKLEPFMKDFLISAFTNQVKALETYQDESGAWHTLIDDDSSYLEISATSGFGYGILKGIRKGYLDKKYQACAKKALCAVMENISEDGTVLNVSYGTGLKFDLNYYKTVEISPMTYGQALAVLCLSEGMKKENYDA